jgi:hypothetical protein
MPVPEHIRDFSDKPNVPSSVADEPLHRELRTALGHSGRLAVSEDVRSIVNTGINSRSPRATAKAGGARACVHPGCRERREAERVPTSQLG